MPRAVKKETEEKLKETKSKATANSKKSSATKKTDKTKSISSASKKSAGVKIAKKSTKKDATVAKEKVVKIPSLATKRKSTSKKVKEEEKDFVNILEYYDLPYRYNETVVKILAQTPKILFVYWDVSDNDREKYKEKYGEYFFNDTYPVLIVRNKTFNYYQEVEINDFANSWYISINDSRSEYSVELGRRFKEYAKRNEIMPHKEDVNSLIHVTESNNLVMPNDRVLLNELQPQVKYRNVKTGEESFKNVRSILANNKLVDFYELYKELYQVEDLSEFLVLGDSTLANPTSSFMNPTSTFK